LVNPFTRLANPFAPLANPFTRLANPFTRLANWFYPAGKRVSPAANAFARRATPPDLVRHQEIGDNQLVTRYLALLLLLATAAFGQEYTTSAGEVSLLTKHATSGMSGSFTLGTGLMSANYGGTLVPDRIWFFGSAMRDKSNLLTSQYGVPTVALRGADAKTTAQLGDRQSLVAAFNSAASPGTALTPRLNTSLFDLHYMMNVSPNSFFTVNVTKNGARLQR
ncbi:MAG TPA: hypothetical protein VF219_23235, partial [Vicinamibacterales bacterium]